MTLKQVEMLILKTRIKTPDPPPWNKLPNWSLGIGIDGPNQILTLGSCPFKLIHFIRCNFDIFTWMPKDMKGNGNSVISHKLNVDSTFILGKQNKNNIGSEKRNSWKMKLISFWVLTSSMKCNV